MEGGRRDSRPAAVDSGQPESFGMFVLRLWMWAVPIVMFAAAVIFGTIAAVDGRWGLLVVMLFMGAIAVSLFIFHWWVLYRFGSRPR